MAEKRQSYYLLIKTRMKFYSNIVLVLLFLLVSALSYGQQNEELISYANDIKLSDSKEAIRIGESILQRLNNEVPRSYEVYIVLIETSFYLEWYDKTIEYILKFKELNYDAPIGVQFDIVLLEAEIYAKLGLNNYKEEAIKNLYGLMDKVEDKNAKALLQWKLQNISVSDFHNFQKKDNIKFDSFIFDNDVDSVKLNEFQKLDYLVIEAIKSSKSYDYESNLKRFLPLDTNTYERLYYENFSLIDAEYYSSIRDHSTAIQILKDTLEYLDSFDSHFFHKNKVVEMLINNLIKIKDKTELINVRKISRKIDNQILRVETSVINKIFEYQSKQNKTTLANVSHQHKQVRVSLLIISVSILLLTSLLWFRYHWQYKQYTEVHRYLNKLKDKPKVIETKSKVKTVSKISDELEIQIVNGLKDFESKKEYLNNNVSLAYLASKLKVNTKYLSSFLNSELQESFSTYINRLRIEYIVGKLKSDSKYLKYKISYLAEAAGYSSHSSFSIAFKAVTGMSPSSFINYLKK